MLHPPRGPPPYHPPASLEAALQTTRESLLLLAEGPSRPGVISQEVALYVSRVCVDLRSGTDHLHLAMVDAGNRWYQCCLLRADWYQAWDEAVNTARPARKGVTAKAGALIAKLRDAEKAYDLLAQRVIALIWALRRWQPTPASPAPRAATATTASMHVETTRRTRVIHPTCPSDVEDNSDDDIILY